MPRKKLIRVLLRLNDIKVFFDLFFLMKFYRLNSYYLFFFILFILFNINNIIYCKYINNNN